MADALVNIILKARDDASKTLAGTRGNLGKLQGAFQKLNQSGIGQVVQGLTGFSLTSLSAAGAAVQAAKFVSGSITDWSAYAESMQKSADLAGITAEEMSRLTQAADDFRVEQSALQTAMGMALKNGFTPTIENLANLSDRFLAIKDPSERAALASKTFGKQWQQIAPLLLQGGDAIRNGTAAINDNLIVTQDAVETNKEYIKVMDDFQDSVTGAKYTLGREVLPYVTTLLELFNNPNQQTMTNALFGSNVWEAFDQGILDLWGVDSIAKDMNETLRDTGAAGDEAADGLDTVATAAGDVNTVMSEYTSTLLFNKAAAGLDSESALALAKSMGLVNEDTYAAMEGLDQLREKFDTNKDGALDAAEATNGYNEAVAGLDAMIKLLQDKHVTVTTTFIDEYIKTSGRGETGGYGGAKDEERATGGVIEPYTPYLVNESPVTRPEVLVTSQNGYMLTKQDAMRALQGGGGGGDINVTQYINTPIDYAKAAVEIADIMRRNK